MQRRRGAFVQICRCAFAQMHNIGGEGWKCIYISDSKCICLKRDSQIEAKIKVGQDIADMTIQEIYSEFTKRELTEYEFRFVGSIILDKSKDLSKRVNDEILAPISVWLKDKEFVSKWQITDAKTPNWAAYKRDQRGWELRAANKVLRIKLERKRQIKELFKETPFLKTLSPLDSVMHDKPMDTMPLLAFFAPFSPGAQAQKILDRQFKDVLARSTFWLMPWQLIIQTEIGSGTTFGSLPTHPDESIAKNIKIAKFQHLLHMEGEGLATLTQTEPFGEISVTHRDCINQNGHLKITDKNGNSFSIEWDELNDKQKNMVITDSVNGKILCQGV